MKYYRIDYKLKENAEQITDCNDFEPVVICDIEGLFEITDTLRKYSDVLLFELVNIRPATEYEIDIYPHFEY